MKNNDNYIIIKESHLLLLLERPDVSIQLLNYNKKNITLTINSLLPKTKYQSIRGLFKYIHKLKKNMFIKDSNINRLNIIYCSNMVSKIIDWINKL